MAVKNMFGNFLKHVHPLHELFHWSSMTHGHDEEVVDRFVGSQEVVLPVFPCKVGGSLCFDGCELFLGEMLVDL